MPKSALTMYWQVINSTGYLYFTLVFTVFLFYNLFVFYEGLDEMQEKLMFSYITKAFYWLILKLPACPILQQQFKEQCQHMMAIYSSEI